MRAMRQRDWSRVFGLGCAAAAVGISVADYGGAQWDALILCLGALMLLRAAADAPARTRAAGLVRALRVILFMFAFAAVTRAQGGVDGAVAGAVGNRILWAVAALLLALPLLRKAPWPDRRAGIEAAAILAMALAFWLVFGWTSGAGSGSDLRALVATAAAANAAPVWQARGQPVTAGLAFGLMLVCILLPAGATLWPVALATLPAALAAGWLRRS